MISSAERTSTKTVIPSVAEGSGRISPLRVANRNASVEMTAGMEDRLSHAKNFAAKLSESRLREMAETYRQRWTPAKRAEKAELIQTVKPWTRATGPKSGPRRAGAGYGQKAMNAALRTHRHFLHRVRRLPYMSKRQRADVFADGMAATLGLITALAVCWAESPLESRCYTAQQ